MDISASENFRKTCVRTLDRVFECPKKIYKIPKFVFYAMGYAFERIFSKTSSGIMNYFRKQALLCCQFPVNYIKNGV